MRAGQNIPAHRMCEGWPLHRLIAALVKECQRGVMELVFLINHRLDCPCLRSGRREGESFCRRVSATMASPQSRFLENQSEKGRKAVQLGPR